MYCVAGYKFDTESEEFCIERSIHTGIYRYRGSLVGRILSHSTVDEDFLTVVGTFDSMKQFLKSPIPRGSLELLFEE